MAAVGDYGVPVRSRFLLCFVFHHKKYGVEGSGGGVDDGIDDVG